MARTTVTVTGMTCAHCVAAVTDEVGALPGVTGVAIDLDSGPVDIDAEAPVDPVALAAAVDEAGYEVVS